MLKDRLQVAPRACASRIHIEMWVSPVDRDDIGKAHHFGRDISVQVQAGGYGQIITKLSAQAAKKLTFAILSFIRNHRAMQVEVDGVHRA